MNRCFRGKTLYESEWVFGSYVVSKEDYIGTPTHAIITEENEHVAGGEYKDCGWHEIDPATLGQHTGISEIFEGDLILAQIESGQHIGFKWPVMPVVFAEGAFCLKKYNGETIPLRAFAPTVVLHVVGNIHDQPQKGDERKVD